MNSHSENLELKEKLKELFQDSTSHGLPRIIKSKSILMKAIWAVCLLASTGYCSYAVIQLFTAYLNYDHVTQVDVYSEMPAKFPVITLCNTNTFQTDVASRFIDEFFNNYSSILANMIDTQRLFFLINNLADYDNQFKKSLSYSLNESLIECQFNMNTCTAKDFEWIFHPMYGNCYRFNSGKDAFNNSRDLAKITSAGALYGLRLELFVDGSKNTRNLLKYFGYHIIVTNQTLNMRFQDGFDIATGMCTNIALNRYFTYRLGQPYNDCKSDLNTIDAFDSDVYRSMIRTNKTYRQSECIFLCFQKKNIASCGCYLKIYDPLDSKVPCLTPNQIICSAYLWNKFIANDILNECASDCPTECDSLNYPTIVTYSDYPSKAYFESSLINHPIIKSKYPNNVTITYDDLRSRVLAFNVFYDQMIYTQTSQQPKMDVFDLVSNMGGLLGLFVGISFLSLVEVIEAIFEIISTLFLNTKIDSIP